MKGFFYLAFVAWARLRNNAQSIALWFHVTSIQNRESVVSKELFLSPFIYSALLTATRLLTLLLRSSASKLLQNTKHTFEGFDTSRVL